MSVGLTFNDSKFVMSSALNLIKIMDVLVNPLLLDNIFNLIVSFIINFLLRVKNTISSDC